MRPDRERIAHLLRPLTEAEQAAGWDFAEVFCLGCRHRVGSARGCTCETPGHTPGPDDGRWVRRLRRAFGEQSLDHRISIATGVSRASIARWRTGEHWPHPLVRDLIVEALQSAGLGHLVTDTFPPHPPVTVDKPAPRVSTLAHEHPAADR